jgi:hypothetical protein
MMFILAGGRLAYRMKTPWRDGTTHVTMSDGELLEKLAGAALLRQHHKPRVAGLFHLLHVISARLVSDRQLLIDPAPRHIFFDELLDSGPVAAVLEPFATAKN